MSYLGALAAAAAVASLLVAFAGGRHDEPTLKQSRDAVTFTGRWVDSGEMSKQVIVEKFVPPAAPQLIERIVAPPKEASPKVAKVVAPRDPICGPRGRTWYTKDNGYRYWRCNKS
jgi:hypothetical protein